MGGGELYCDTCGLAPVPVAAASGSARSAAGGAVGGPESGRAASERSSRSSKSSSRSSRRSVSGRLSRSLSGTSTGRSVSVRSSRGTGSGPTRGKLGAGLVTVPPIPRPDPAAGVLDNPQVPERKRYCSKGDCGAPVGRSRGDKPGRTEGFCTKCGHPYSFSPKLRAGDVVHGQYEVVGCLAHGGLGWIYLALDRAVSDRWVVLKGLLDTGDEDALAAAVSERRFLAEIEHPNIVRIYNFVEHLDQRTGTLDGYIVMAYVGGKSLKEIANERRGTDGKREPLPVATAIAYAIEALDALGYLHSRNLLYCDFKVDNAIQQEDRLELIDMGAVRRMDDVDSAIYGTVGYQAPEVAELGPSVASDLYTVARTLAVLTFDFQGYTNVFADSLPDPDNIDVFSRYESFYRLLVRATDPDPDKRFASAEEMADQLLGVLREVVALETGKPRPALSTLFGPEIRVVDTELVHALPGDSSRLGADRRRKGAALSPALGAGGVNGANGAPPAFIPSQPAGRPGPPAGPGAPAPAGAPPSYSTTVVGAVPLLPAVPPGTAPGTGSGFPSVARLDTPAAVLALPVPHVDPGDPNAGFLAGLSSAAPAELIAALQSAPVESVEKRLRDLRARLELNDGASALLVLRGLADDDLEDWRVVWHRGLTALATGDHETAALSFDAVYDAFPGESAPKLALGICAEVLGQLDNAAEYYRLVWTTDHSYVSAAFGLARVRLAAGDRAGAVQALESVPEASIHFTAARVAAIRARLRERSPHEPLLDDLRAAGRQVEQLQQQGLDADRREQLSTEVLGSALDWVLAGERGAPPAAGARPQLLGSVLDERGLRFGLERSYRVLARLAQKDRTRIELVERANRFRPRTWV
ncbi:tetratricopeptide repeat protein [Streptomyces sp. H10-C2]|uniref:serine/threonine-protein kinase n=1 Tax=unclassified Streptomyces TaxID=2593676 RepID=UPI0024BAAE8E|nr:MULTISPECIES: serine/threonine-protein kinase [unclassified Streptomyces]MDJ0340081.1 tetratricopeptide repeat protein [Streptomyces sp. PH10-H1]MDJ0369282.1 tetratricopeptide repeat protein [Streptomyces sp. H10-C2]